MNQEELKGIGERRAFERLVRFGVLSPKRGSVRKGDPHLGEPDIVFTYGDGEKGAVEVMESCVPEFAAMIANLGDDVTATVSATVWGSDDVEEKVRQKLGKHYRVPCPVDLLIYSDGRQGLPDAVVADKIDFLLRGKGMGPFRSVYYFGNDDAERLWVWPVSE